MNPNDQAARTVSFLLEVLPDDPDANEFIGRAMARIQTDGANDYFDAEANQMLFERLSAEEVVTMLEEELLDAANYAYMLETKGVHLPQFTGNIYRLWKRLQNRGEEKAR